MKIRSVLAACDYSVIRDAEHKQNIKKISTRKKIAKYT